MNARHDIDTLRFTQYLWYNSLVQTLCLKYRVFPTKEQARKLEDTLETCRLVYNSLVNDRVFQVEIAQVSVNDRHVNEAACPWRVDLSRCECWYREVSRDIQAEATPSALPVLTTGGWLTHPCGEAACQSWEVRPASSTLYQGVTALMPREAWCSR